MVNSVRAEAEASRDAKLRRMGVQVRTADEYDDRGTGHTGPAADGTQGEAQGRYADKFSTDDGKKAKALILPVEGRKNSKRLDRPAYAKGGRVDSKKGTTVNVIVAGGGPKIAPPVPPTGGMPVPGPGAVPPSPLPAAVPPQLAAALGAAGASGGMPRKRGGRVGVYPKMTKGAGGGEGREEKVKAYGKRAYEGAANKNG